VAFARPRLTPTPLIPAKAGIQTASALASPARSICASEWIPAFAGTSGFEKGVRDAAFAGLFACAPIVGALGSSRVHAVGWKSLAGD
jgi:hypothetical protein